ncbi:L-aminoadipate-semialdehyde dehydrogenase [Obba rivulosa]|uniref:L-aminoadipate-semialdehyde dehydrogenase n=1 Tax=Obba rivulosa TaxID=1052685 RepID=A0A8E2DMU4_9APHY|nr:L-aminoadipate-semialdehyde dehydrogenase [Obba rivulosa]
MSTPDRSILSLTELVQRRANDLPDKIACYTGIDEPGSPLRSLTYSQVLRAVDRLCAYYSSEGVLPESARDDIPSEGVAAILTTTAIDLSLLEVALAKLGLSPLLISGNNSVPAVAHLCKITHASHLIFGAKYASEVKEVEKILAEEGYQLVLVEEKRFPLWGIGGVDATHIEAYCPRLTPEQEHYRTAVILHSSGSTGFPKPVFVSHKGFIANLSITLPQPSFSALPVYHGFGHYSSFRCMYHAVPFTLFPPHLPLTTTNICRIIKASPTHCTQCVAVPYVIKLLAESEEGIRALAKFDVVSYSGAAFPDELGDRLTQAGVNILSHYGSTETGGLLSSKRDFARDKAWNWLRIHGPVADYITLEDRGAGTFELVVRDGYPAKIVSNRPDNSYATKDLFVKHHERGNWVKYFGRLDDTIVQLLGEKTNPVPIELTIRGNSPYVSEAIVFGTGRPQIGCLILPSDLGMEISKDRDTFMSTIWPAIEKANSEAPSHSQLLPEMIHILPYGTEVPVATKMSILRSACYAKFKDIIDNVYDRYERGEGGSKLSFNELDLERFLYNAFIHTLGPVRTEQLDKRTDLFAFGVDSLQAVRVRNICQARLNLHGRQLAQNVVYENPSIEKLVDHILTIRSGGTVAPSNDDQHALVVSMAEKWYSKLHHSSMCSLRKNGISIRPHVVVLTGATGFLGAYILQQLVVSPDVSRVLCLVRADSHENAIARVQKSLQSRKLRLPLEEMAKIDALAANVNQENLGLRADEYEQIRSTATIIIHNAWPVNFLLGVDSFDEHLGGVVNLINLCFQSNTPTQARFFFSSSIATQGASSGIVPEDFSQSPATALQSGYGHSKWVAEKICEHAAKLNVTNIRVLRIGQLVGDTTNGVWNETEAWPLMFKTAETIGALPHLDEELSWIPIDVAARAITEIATHPLLPDGAVYHIVNPQFTNWDAILAGLRSAGLKFDTVAPELWLGLLDKSDASPEQNPTRKLLSYYQNRIARKSDRKQIRFSVNATTVLSDSIGNCAAIPENLVQKWVDNWRDSGFLRGTSVTSM